MELPQKKKRTLDEISIRWWIKMQAIKTESGALLDFHDHRYLRDIYSDMSPKLACLKAGQIGFSTMAILKTIWLARNFGVNVGYILPTVEMVQKFVGSKVNRIASENPVIAGWMRDKDSIALKQIDKYFIHYLGAQTDRSAIMLSLDLLVADEYDKAPQKILEIYESRLQHSKFGYKWVFSNPTIPDFGVDRFWQMSDQKKWHITHSCGKQYIMDESCINFTSEIYQCPHCQSVITREEIRMGEWKATAKGDWSGYWIPLWINPIIDAKKICDYKKTKPKDYFYNFVAGLPYVNSNDTLSQQTLEANLSSEVNEQSGRILIGMDTGKDLHYFMMNKEGGFYHGKCERVDGNPNYDPYAEIDKLMKTYPSAILIADQGGDLIGIAKLQAKYPNRVYLCMLTKDSRSQQIIKWSETEGERGKVVVDRNRMIQLIVDQLNERRMTFNGSKEDWQPFFDHCLNIFRVKEIQGTDENDPQYGWRWVWKRKGPDHYFFAMLFALVGFDKFKEASATIVGMTPFDDIPMGKIF